MLFLLSFIQLLTAQNDIEKLFCNHICTYNNILAMTSESVNNDKEAVNDGISPYVFKLYSELSHKASSLFSSDEKSLVFAQLYMYDLANVINYQMTNIWNAHIDYYIMVTLDRKSVV